MEQCPSNEFEKTEQNEEAIFRHCNVCGVSSGELAINLTTVHDALSNASGEIKAPEGLHPATYRVTPQIKELAERICEQNATTLSQFVRKCCEGLVEDYLGHRIPDEDEEAL